MQRLDGTRAAFRPRTKVSLAANYTKPLSILELLAMFLVLIFLVAGCQTVNQQPPAPVPAAAIVAEPVPVKPLATRQRTPWTEWTAAPAKSFDEAVLDSASALLAMVELPAPGEKYSLVINPPVDAISGVQSQATRKLAASVAELVRKRFPQFSLRPFAPASLRQSPLVLIGALTPVNSSGQAEGQREAYRICLALADLKSGKVLSKEMARAPLQGVNHMPTPYFQDSPAWMHDRALDRYVETCENSKPGAPVEKLFIDGLPGAALINQGIAAYDSGRYKEALERFSSAAADASADRLRIENGLYLANTKLGRTAEANGAFGKFIEHAMAENRLAMNFLFRPGSASFTQDKSANGNYSVWLKEIGQRALQSDICLEVVGHTTRTGSEALNERLSLERAEYIRSKLEEAAPLAGRTTARGAGSRENLVGIGKDDLSDALDRRVVFQVIPCAALTAQTANRY